MDNKTLQVLLVRKSVAGSFCLVNRLEKRGCNCQFASSYGDALVRLNSQAFDLVLSEDYLPDGSGYRLISWLLGSHTTLFFSFPVEDSCWWLPAIVYGQNCWGAPALRPSEFVTVLDEILLEMTSLVPRASVPASPALNRLCPGGCLAGSRDGMSAKKSVAANAPEAQNQESAA